MTTPSANPPPEAVAGSDRLSLTATRWKWSLTPVPPPRVDRALARGNYLARTAGVLRHSVLRLEYWLSPNGLLREWCRRCLLLALFLAVPLLCFSPLVTVFLEHLTIWSAALLQICSNLAQIPGHLSIGVLIAIPGALLLRWLARH